MYKISILFIVGCAFGVTCWAQTGQVDPHSPNRQLKYIVDSVEMPAVSMRFLDLKEIADINITDGAMYIRMNGHPPLVSLNEVIELYHIDKNKPYLFIVGTEVLDDTTGVRIDPRLIEKVVSYRKSDFRYLKAATADLAIFDVKLFAELPKPGTIRLQ